jgi:hypothetical protein
MATLIARVRDMVAEATTDNVSDITIEDLLDRTRMEIRYVQCVNSPSYQAGGSIIYDTWFAPNSFGDWEDDVAFCRANYVAVTPSVSENIVGKWVFSTTDFPPCGVYPPLYITGKSYDPFMAAAKVCDYLIGKIKGQFDYKGASKEEFFFNQKIKNLLDLKQQFLNSARIVSVSAWRSDEAMTGRGGW